MIGCTRKKSKAILIRFLLELIRSKKTTKKLQYSFDKTIRNMFRKIVATTLSTDFRKACEVISSKCEGLKVNEVLVKTRYAGINASDINFSAGRYSTQDTSLPMDVGLEGIGEIVEVGEGVPTSMVGKPVGYIWNGSFGEYLKIPAKICMPLPDLKPEYVSLLISGLTASICLERSGRISSGEKVFISAAAGGLGHIAVQLAKNAGCHVIGTCSSQEKMNYLKSIGCDHVINYKKENLREVLKSTYPKGIDVFIESIGGETFNTCLDRLAVNGRLVVLGFIDSYQSAVGIDRSQRNATLTAKLLSKSSTVTGFMLLNHADEYRSHFLKLVQLVNDGKLNVLVDQSDENGKPFVGIDSTFDAVDYLYSRKSKGKIVVDLSSVGKDSKL